MFSRETPASGSALAGGVPIYRFFFFFFFFGVAVSLLT